MQIVSNPPETKSHEMSKTVFSKKKKNTKKKKKKKFKMSSADFFFTQNALVFSSSWAWYAS